MNLRNLIIIVVLSATIALVTRSIVRINSVAQCVSGLSFIASVNDGELSWNPLSKDYYVISPRIAAYVLLNFDYPYQRPDCPRWNDVIGPPIHSFVRNRQITNPDAEAHAARMLSLVSHFAGRGYSIDEYNMHGYTPLLNAISGADVEAVSWLMELGANPHLPITKGTTNFGRDAFTYAEILGDPTRLSKLESRMNLDRIDRLIRVAEVMEYLAVDLKSKNSNALTQ